MGAERASDRFGPGPIRSPWGMEAYRRDDGGDRWPIWLRIAVKQVRRMRYQNL